MALSKIEQIMLQHGIRFTRAAVQEVQYCYLCFRGAYNRLSEAALSAQMCRWPHRPKHHYLHHLLFDSADCNPLYYSNYINEDFVRRVKMVAAGSHPAFLSRHVSLKYALQLCMRWRS